LTDGYVFVRWIRMLFRGARWGRVLVVELGSIGIDEGMLVVERGLTGQALRGAYKEQGREKKLFVERWEDKADSLFDV
jgi:hypothetical protein